LVETLLIGEDMKKLSMISLLLLLTFLVAACSGGGEAQETPGVNNAAGTPGVGFNETSVPNNPTFAPTVAPTIAAATEIPTLVNPTVPAGAITNGTAVSGTGVPATGANNDQYQLCSWTGYKVLDANNNDLGTSKDFVLNPRNGKIKDVMLGAGGFLGMGEKNILVPWEQFTMDPSKAEKTLVFKGNTDLLKNAPDFNVDSVDFSASDWNKNYTAYWSGNGTAVAAPAGTAAANPTVVPQERPVIQNANFVLASNLCGSWVVDKSVYGQNTVNATPVAAAAGTAQATVVNGTNELTADQTIGEVQTVLVDPKTGKATYLVIDTKDKLGLSGKWIPVPLQSVQVIFNNTTPDKLNDLLVMVPIGRLTKAPNYDSNNLPDLSSPDWDADLRTFWGNAQ
jgi:sporulation protein YlmC with PRC-barrel domain